MATRDWEEQEEFDGIRWDHKTRKLPSGSPQSIRIVTSGGSANEGDVAFGSGKIKHLRDGNKAEKFARQYIRTH